MMGTDSMNHNHEEAMSLHCSNCGAQLHVSPYNDKFVTCDYCGSTYKVADLLHEAGEFGRQAGSQQDEKTSLLLRIVGLVVVGLIVAMHLFTTLGSLVDDDLFITGILALQTLLWAVVFRDILAKKVSGRRVATCIVLAGLLLVPMLYDIGGGFGGSGYSSERDYGAVSWDSLVLGAIIPEFNGNDKGYIESNTSDYLSVEYKDVDESAFRSYVSSCQSAGYTAEQEYTESSFTAFNAEGYRLYMTYYSFDGDEMSITVEAPKPMSILIWPETTIAGDLPVPDSGQGYITTADEDYFTAYIGETSRDEVNTYISKCMALGFNQEQNMRDGYLWAKRSDGARLNVRYEGNNVMYISIYDNA